MYIIFFFLIIYKLLTYKGPFEITNDNNICTKNTCVNPKCFMTVANLKVINDN